MFTPELYWSPGLRVDFVSKLSRMFDIVGPKGKEIVITDGKIEFDKIKEKELHWYSHIGKLFHAPGYHSEFCTRRYTDWGWEDKTIGPEEAFKYNSGYRYTAYIGRGISLKDLREILMEI